MAKLSIIVPTLNEEGNIETLLSRIDASLRSAGIDYEVVFVDDHSTDNTVAVIERCSDRYPIQLQFKRGHRGKAYSLLEGFSYAQHQLLAIIDADLQYPPEALPEIV